jgi:hypothetical protein
MFNKKTGFMFLLILVFIFIGSAQALSQEHDPGNYFDESSVWWSYAMDIGIGVEMGAVLNDDGSDPDAILFNWGIDSTAFDAVEGSLYLGGYFILFQGDYDTGLGTVILRLEMDFEKGLSNHFLYWPAMLIFLDFFGEGNDLYFCALQRYEAIDEEYDSRSLSNGLIYSILYFDLDFASLVGYVADFNNRGVWEDANHNLVPMPDDVPETWEGNSSEYTGRDLIMLFLSDIDLYPVTLDFGVSFDFIRSQLLTMDEKIDGIFTNGGYVGFADDENLLSQPLWSVGANVYMNLDLEQVGYLSVYLDYSYSFFQLSEIYGRIRFVANQLMDSYLYIQADVLFDLWTVPDHDLNGETQTLHINQMTRAWKFEIVVDASYEVPITTSFSIVPNLQFVMDLAEVINFATQDSPYPGTDYANDLPHIPISVGIGADFKVGPYDFLVFPVSVRFTNILSSTWKEWLDDGYRLTYGRGGQTGGTARNSGIRIIINAGIKLSFIQL